MSDLSSPHHYGAAAERDLRLADWMYERIIRSIKTFEETLSEHEELGVRLIGAPGFEIFRIADVGYWNPDVIKFYGFNADGHRVELMQHVSQVNLLLAAVPKMNETPRRIGFVLVSKFEQDKLKKGASS